MNQVILPPDDQSSLIVPVHLDAWVVSSSNQQQLAWYYANYENLGSFINPMPDAFDTSDTSKPEIGVHLHWALPDALTHGYKPAPGSNEQFVFPKAPNRWLVTRFNTTSDGKWQAKLWVVESDYLGEDAKPLVATNLSSPNTLVIAIQNAFNELIAEGTLLQLSDPVTGNIANVTTSAAVKPTDLQIGINAFDFSNNNISKGSTVTVIPKSSYLNPFSPTQMNVAPGQNTEIGIQNNNIGTSYSIESWEATTNESGELFLTAVGPGDISFAAYVPSVRDVFSFTDTELPATGLYHYSYMVTGWYSDTKNADPLRGINSFMPEVWATQQDWQGQLLVDRFKTLLQHYKWSLNTDMSKLTTSCATSLYHGLLTDVQWPYTTPGSAGIDGKNVRVAVGNTSVEALSALIQTQAQGDTTLSTLVQAAMYDLLNDYDQQGGMAVLRQKMHQATFGSDPGGATWEVVSKTPENAGDQANPVALTADQATQLNKQLAALNLAQRNLEASKQKLKTMQAELYTTWMKVGMGNSPYATGWDGPPTTIPQWDILFPFVQNVIYKNLATDVWNQHCLVSTAQAQLPDSNNETTANTWANTNWTFTSETVTKLTLDQLGLKLKSGTAARFWHPNDPVVMISGANRAQKFGEDGRYNADGTLTCRLPGQTITGIVVPNQPDINIDSITKGGVNLAPFGPYKSIPAIPSLVQEAFFCDPLNASLIANAVKGNAQTIGAAITGLVTPGSTTNATWAGSSPAPFANMLWQQAWVPLFLEWQVDYFPTRSGTSFSIADWQFDGEKYTWKGTGTDFKTSMSYKGRTILTPQAPLLVKDKIRAYLKGHPDIDTPALEDLLDTVAGWDIISQTLSGFTDQLITLLTQQAFPPTPVADMTVKCPGPGVTQPSVTALIGDEYHNMPILQSSDINSNSFFPVRGGFARFPLHRLQIVDTYGQIFPLAEVNTPSQGFLPIISAGMKPTPNAQNPAPAGALQLPPRIVQSSRLDMRVLANDNSGQDIYTAANPNPVCGWLLPNHLDSGIAVYDENGVSLGELLPLPAPNNWRPRPGAPGANPPPATPDQIANPTLKAVVKTLYSQKGNVFTDMLKVIDETLWQVDPMGGRQDQMLSVLIGRPLAVVQMNLQLNLMGEPAFSQLWNKMAVTDGNTTPAVPKRVKDTGNILNIPFPVKLGSLDLRNDGLIGYFLGDGTTNYSTFYASHYGSSIPASDTFIKPIVTTDNTGAKKYQGDINLQCNGPAVKVTMLVDPRGEVHAYTGVLPVTTAALPGNLIEDFIAQLKVTFQTGPVIADPGTLRIPQPAEDKAVWKWVQATAPGTWSEQNIMNADDKARMPDELLQLREGWLQLSNLDSTTNNGTK